MKVKRGWRKRWLPSNLVNLTKEQHEELASEHLTAVEKHLFLTYCGHNGRVFIRDAGRQFGLSRTASTNYTNRAVKKLQRALELQVVHILAENRRWSVITIDQLQLSKRVNKLLQGFENVEQLCNITTGELLHAHPISFKCIGELIDRLDEIGAPHQFERPYNQRSFTKEHHSTATFIGQHWCDPKDSAKIRRQKINAAAHIALYFGWVPENVKNMYICRPLKKTRKTL